MSKSKFIQTLSESKNIFVLEKMAVVYSLVKDVFIGTPGSEHSSVLEKTVCLN